MPSNRKEGFAMPSEAFDAIVDAPMRATDIRSICGIAGQRVVSATVHYPGEADRVVTFYGTGYGTPGPVFMNDGYNQCFVVDADRFGETFGVAWVNAFYSA